MRHRETMISCYRRCPPSLARSFCVVLLPLLAVAGGRAALAQSGLSSTGSRLIYETSANPLHPPAAGDQLGYAVAAGDFDGDGYEDLAIGLRSDDDPIFGLADVGQVQIRFGGPLGLDAVVAAKYLWQGGSASVDAPETGDHFGESLVAGDFDDDGFDDLAIGVPGEDVGTISNAGAIEVRYGAANRSQALEIRRQLFHENTTGVPDTAGAEDEFGHSLAAGDFDSDTFDDLAIGVPLESVSGFRNAGRVFVLYGTASGIGVADAQTLDEDASGVPHSPATDEFFGAALAAADFDHDGWCDLAVSATGWFVSRGIVFVLPGGASGLTGVGTDSFMQGSGGLAGVGEAADFLGNALAVGSFNGDAFPDLVIGVPGDAGAGAVHVLFGSALGVSSAGSQFWTPLSPGVPGEPELADLFGFSVAAGDFDHDGFDELAIGVPFEENFRGPEEGDVVVLHGSPSGPTGTGAQEWNLEVAGILGDMNPGDRLGWWLAVGDFDGSRHQDLVIGTPHDGTIGGVLVLYGALFADDFETGSTTHWSGVAP